jgi:CDK-activating kinase assembly factor MAT1
MKADRVGQRRRMDRDGSDVDCLLCLQIAIPSETNAKHSYSFFLVRHTSLVMSRLAQRGGPTGFVRAGGDVDDICPVCKSSRYLNPNMKFLVNPECYHKMCESCVDRIFSHGPATCPVAGCRKTLRKHRFRAQTFEDIKVEREVDIRRRVAEVFNRREDDFETLLDYNNYLNEVEDVTFNLVNNIDVAETEKKLARYKEQNVQAIKRNANLEHDEKTNLQANQAAEREQARLRRVAARRELEEETREKEQGQRNIIDKLASGQGDAAMIIREGERVMLKKTTARRADAEKILEPSQASEALAVGNASNGTDSFFIKGLKRKAAPQVEKPYDPFQGLEYVREYHILQDQYDWEWLDNARNDVSYTAGGYDVREYTQRALTEAFAGLGVCVADEMMEKDAASSVPSNEILAASPRKAQAVGGNIKASGDDIF